MLATYLIWVSLNRTSALWVLPWLGAAPVGAITAGRRPRHPVGWLLLAIGGGGTLSQMGFAYHPSPAPTVLQALLVDGAVALFFFSLLLCGLLLAVFPTGELGWRRRLLGPALTGLVLAMACQAVAPMTGGDVAMVNPLKLPTLGAVTAAGVASVATELALVALGAVLLLAVVDLGRRAWGSRGVQRQQLKWLAYSSLLLVFALLPLPISAAWAPVGLAVATNAIFLSIGLAVVRYHLYDIDRVASRAVTYLVVLGLLGAVYLGLVLLLGQVLPLRGSVSVVLAVLGAAALLAPLRRRVREVVDRRFNRSRYDAQAVVRAFAARVGDPVAVERVTGDLLAAVQGTVAPAHAGLWVRPW